jgi:integrase/recombinase XerD
MPPRRRPTASAGPATRSVGAASAGYSDVSSHLPGFTQYLKAEVGLSANTIQAYGSDLAQFADWLRKAGGNDLFKLDRRSFTEYLRHLHGRKLAASSVGRHLVSIKMFFRYLVLEGLLKESFADQLGSPKLWRRLPRILSPDRVDRLLVAPTVVDRLRLRDRCLLALMYATGCRASEVCRLTLDNVHLGESYCRCVGKGNKERLVSLNPVAIAAIQAYLEHERPLLGATASTPQLLLNRNGGPLSRLAVWRIIKKYARRIGCGDGVSPHTLRHSFATHMLAGGAEIRALQEMLGHASIATTQVYTQVEHSRLKAIHRSCHPRG